MLSDLAYAEIYFEGEPPPSILEIPGAMDIAVEFTTLSKTYAMPGWRVGFAVGNERLIHALTRVKSYLDYGAFTPIQVAAAAALNGPQDCIDEIRAIYQPPPRLPGRCAHPRRLADPVAAGDHVRLGADPRDVRASRQPRILEAPAREGWRRGVPGVGFGEYGEGYVRIALVENEQRIRQAARNIRKFLAKSAKTLHNVIPIASKAKRTF